MPRLAPLRREVGSDQGSCVDEGEVYAESDYILTSDITPNI